MNLEYYLKRLNKELLDSGNKKWPPFGWPLDVAATTFHNIWRYVMSALIIYDIINLWQCTLNHYLYPYAYSHGR